MSRAQDNQGKSWRPSAAAGGQSGAGRGLAPTAPGQRTFSYRHPPPPSVTGRKLSMEAGKAVHQPALPGQEPRRPSAAKVLVTKEAVKVDKAGAAATAQKAQAPPKAPPPPLLLPPPQPQPQPQPQPPPPPPPPPQPPPQPQPPMLHRDQKKAPLDQVPVAQVAVKSKSLEPQHPAKLTQEAGKAVHQPALPGQEPRRPSAAKVLVTKEAVKVDKAGAAATAQKAQAPPKAPPLPPPLPLPPPQPPPPPQPQPPMLHGDHKKAHLDQVPVAQVAVKPKSVEPQHPAKLTQAPVKPKPQPSRDSRQGKQLNVAALPQPTPVVKRPDHEEATGVSCATRTASSRYTKSGMATAVNLSNAPRTVSSTTPFAKATLNKLSEHSFAKSRLTTLGTRKMYYFQDPPLPKEVHIAVVLLLLAILTVALLLGYDVYHSFAHIPRRSNVTARSPVPMATTPLPTPFFMR
ncbi:WAS/WASL-interacting protein family member 3-like isoform X2 [Dermacentor albipictus]|uniref:WAS/WASL-interacting protein family member 3-like isoform X2 n=1 Tax=Dermacentor albipictus TaxID=60249 RepID=UPI0038FD0625